MSVTPVQSSPGYLPALSQQERETASPHSENQPAPAATGTAPVDTVSIISSKAESASATSSRDTPVEDLMAHLQGLLESTSSPLAQSSQHIALYKANYGSSSDTGGSFQQNV